MVENNPCKIFKLKEYNRHYVIVPDGRFPVYVIKAEDGREIPDQLKGHYIRVTDAGASISRFLHREEEKAISSAKWLKRKKLTEKRAKYEEMNKINGSS